MRSVFKYILLSFFIFIASVYFAFSQIQFEKCRNENYLINLETQAIKKSFEWNKDSIDQSVNLFIELSSCLSENQKFEKAAYNLRQAGDLNSILGLDEQAIELYRKGLKLTDNFKTSGERIYILSELSLINLKGGNADISGKYLDEATSLSQTSDNYSAKAIAIFCQAELELYKRNNVEANNLYIKALTLSKSGNDLRTQARILLYLGYDYIYQEKVELGHQTLLDALKLYNKIGDPRGQAFTNIAIANALAFMDRRQDAINVYKMAESGFPDNLDIVEKARLYNGIASIYERYQDWTLAIIYRKKALILFNKAGHKYGELATLIGLGKLNFLDTKTTLGSQYFENALILGEQINDKFYLAVIYKEIGTYSGQMGKSDKAIKYFNKSLALLEANNSTREISLVYDQLGDFYANNNNFKVSEDYFNKALEIHRKIKNSFSESQTLFRLAYLKSIENKDFTALNYLKNSLTITENLNSDVLNSELTKIYFSNVYDRYELYIKVLMKMHRRLPKNGYDLKALQVVEKSRSRSILENLRLAEINFIADADPKTVEREKNIRNSLNLKSNKLTELLSSSANKTEVTKLDEEINELKNEMAEIYADLKQKSPIYSAIKSPSEFAVKEFQNKILDQNTVLLEFSFGKEESYVWLIGKDSFEVFVLPKREVLENQIDKLLEFLVSSRIAKRGEEIADYQKRVIENEKKFNKESRVLSEQLFGQFAEKLKDKRLIIVPDGKLRYFPVSALPVPGGVEPFLLKNEIVYEPSASTLNLLRMSAKKAEIPMKDFLVFADPIYSKNDVRLMTGKDNVDTKSVEIAAKENEPFWNNFRSMDSLNSLRRLPASKEEADSILGVFDPKTSNIVSDFSANRKGFLGTNIADYKVLHFATHGYLNEERPELSGIVLSQYDKHGNKQDGFIRLQDIYSLNLSADLVVLSACDTGIGKEVKGEGLMSLTNGFLQVGAKTVISSSWKVDDEATLLLMKNFYKTLADENLTPSEALRKAQIKMYQDSPYKSPFYWAAFTVQGEYNKTLKLSKQFNYADYLLMIVVLSVFFGLYRSYLFYQHYSTRNI